MSTWDAIIWGLLWPFSNSRGFEEDNVANKVWGIKLGTSGRCVPFCKKHIIVGVGWKHVDLSVIRNGNRHEILLHLQEIYPEINTRKLGQWIGSLFRFTQECRIDD